MDETTIIDAEALSRHLQLPVTWVREYTRSRATDQIPHLRFGRYVRFKWGSPELSEWINRHLKRGSQ